MIEIDNKTSLTFNAQLLEKITQSLTPKDVELIIVNNDEIRQINKVHRNIDKTTDVLSFPYDQMPMQQLLGSIVICAQYVVNVSQSMKHSQEDEFALLYIHGLLHLLGYDHENDNGEMQEKEVALIKQFKLPESLIQRSQG